MSSPSFPLPPSASVPVSSSPSVCPCLHLTSYLDRHPQTSLIGSVSTQSAALSSVVSWLGTASPTAAALVPVIPTHTQPTTELQALLQVSINLQEEYRYDMGCSKMKRYGHDNSRTKDVSNFHTRLERLTSILPHCSAITCTSLNRTLMACLECTNVGCWIPKQQHHHHQHATPQTIPITTTTPAHSRQHAQDKQHTLGILKREATRRGWGERLHR